MAAQPKPQFGLSARFLGPVLSIDSNFSERPQNLVFARNGTGKSFLSRAFRYIDKAGNGKDIPNAATYLVSDESPDGKGNLKISLGTTTLASIALDKKEGTANIASPERIFHVFSEDFVHEELRERFYNPDGDIENKIAVDSDEIMLDDAKRAVSDAEKALEEALQEMQEKFDAAKVAELNGKAEINKQLKEYKGLSFETILSDFTEKPGACDPQFSDLLKGLDALKAIPAEPTYPEKVEVIFFKDQDFEAVNKSLQRITSPSSVAEDIKAKVAQNRSFYETGATLVEEHDLNTCPFCEQGIEGEPAASTVAAYIAYFKDEEATHKKELERLCDSFSDKEREIIGLSPRISTQTARFDFLKRLVPSQTEVMLSSCEDEISKSCQVLNRIVDAIELKKSTLSEPVVMPSDEIGGTFQDLEDALDQNFIKSSALKTAIEKADEERKGLQRNACKAFSVEFSREYWAEIENIRKLNQELERCKGELALKAKASAKTDAKERVADTFELLVRQFFGEKYVFDRQNFMLMRGDKEMKRGVHRTLSDGEKTAIAFCYFVASIHKKVKSNSDYKSLFLIFDDPVTSMSYDFVFTIAQTLKNLSVSREGEISTNPDKIDGNVFCRPDLIILTHSSYFFNVSLTNRVVKENAAFSLVLEKETHRLKPLASYVAPFQQQLKDVYDVAENGKEPDHQTGNSVRSVLEAVGRFCRPDKDSLTNFITYLAGEESFELKSVMINNLSHGTYYEETPSPDDLRIACKETIEVVNKFAGGQIELLRGSKAS